MEFLKSCRPNLYTLGDVSRLHYTIHAFSPEPDHSDPAAVVETLREGGLVCALEDSKVTIFHLDQDKEAQDLERLHLVLQGKDYNITLEGRGSLGDDQDESSAEQGVTIELLQDAIDAAIGLSLTKDPAVTRLAPRTWLFCDDTNSSGSVLVRLRFHLTAADVLYCTTVFDSVSLISNAATVSGSQVVLCPIGISARTIPSNDPGIIANSTWKKSLMEWLKVEFPDAVNFSDWTPVCLQTGELVIWPSQLLLTSACPKSELDPAWKQWFIGAEEIGGFLSPLTFAEDWYKRASDPETQAETTQSSTEQPALSTATADVVYSLATSPPFVQRLADQQAAMSGIYPTPPDGLVPASQLQAQQDNVMQIDTGPSNPEATLALNSQTPNISNGLNPGDGDGDGDEFDRGATDLFGDDIGTMDFAGDIGDADFSFFDEPDDVPDDGTAVDAVMQDVADGDEGGKGSEKESELAEPPDEGSRQQSPYDEPRVEDDESSSEKPEDVITEKSNDGPPALVPPELLEKPLSPFGIKERLLPPPIPASAMHSSSKRGHEQHNRRNSTFEPVVFRDGLNLGSQYTSRTAYATSPRRSESRPDFDISLPPKRKKPRVRGGTAIEYEDSTEDSERESEEDSFDSDSSSSDDDMPPKLPWDTKKRKRPLALDSLRQTEGHSRAQEDDERGDGISKEQALDLLEVLQSYPATDRTWTDSMAATTIFESIRTPMDLFELSKMDTVFAAQIIGEQSLSATLSITAGYIREGPDGCLAEISLQQATDTLFLQQLCARHVNDLGSLALIKEPPPRVSSAPGQPRPGVPRPHQRTDSGALRPDLFTIPPPYVKLQRGSESYELLPPALDFWETLSLGPTNGQKDVRAYCVFPWNEDLHRLVDGFLGDMATAYESCKLGTHVHVRNVDEEQKLDDYEDGLAPVELNGDTSLEAVLKAFQSTCSQLGTFLANVGHEDSNRTFVVYLINPFLEPEATQYLCTCFWLLCKAYRDNAPKTHKRMSRSDVVLQLVPIGMIASNGAPVISSTKQMAILAREVYDRCPPSHGESLETGPAVRCLVAPAVELAEPPPKRIGFQLSAEPPADLMHEGSALHLSCAISPDGFWLVASWIDMTGRYQRTQVFSLRGKTLSETIEEVWERTKDILQLREVFWRIFILIAFDLDPSIVSTWRKTTEKSRRQPFSVTLMGFHADPFLRLIGPSAGMEDGSSQTATGFLTPATTPGGTALTVSPDAGQSTAPPTPAPSDGVVAMAENDPEAHFVDLQDETWGILFSQSFAQDPDAVVKALISGAIYKRGQTGKESEARSNSCFLPALHVRLYWTMQVRPNSHVDDGHVKQAEMTLREVLRMYRNLNALTRAKELATSLDNSNVDMAAWPIHLLAATKAAKAVNGLIK